MFVSHEEALAAQEARHRLRTTKAGVGWIFCPYTPGAVSSLGHYVPPNGWEQCAGEGKCPYHHQRVIPKLHVPALCATKPVLAAQCLGLTLPGKKIVFRPQDWTQKIVELTGGVISTFCQPSRPDQLALVWREAGRPNGKLHLRWLDNELTGVPDGVAKMTVQEILPSIIHGHVATGATVELDTRPDAPIKHKIYDRQENPAQPAQPELPVLGDPDFNRKFTAFAAAMVKGGAA